MRRTALECAGIAVYPEKNAWRLANALLRPDLVTTPRLGQWMDLPDLATMLALPDLVRQGRKGQADLIVSSEEFCMMRNALEAFALRSLLGAGFARIVPILYLRNEADWRAAREDQLRKTGYLDRQRALPDARSADGTWYYDRQALIAFWASIGTPAIVDYDAVCTAEGDVLPSFGRTIGQPGLFDGLDLRLNTRA